MVVMPSNSRPVSIFLNSNESAFGPSSAVVESARAAVFGIERYIENQEYQLVPALAEAHGLDPSRIAIGCGSDDLLVRLARAYLNAGDELVRSANSYLKVPNYAHSNDAVPVAAPDKEFGALPEAILESVTNRTRVVYLANPDNPSGSYLPVSEVRRLHAGLPSNVLLIVDCAYFEYVDQDNPSEIMRLAEQCENVVVTRTFSKVYGLAGARAGWIYASPAIVDVVNRLCYTFPLSTPSLSAVMTALKDQKHVDFVRSETLRLRTEFADRFSALGIRVYPSQGNFLLLELDDAVGRSAEETAFELRRQGIAVRRFTAPAYGDCLRVTIGYEGDMQACCSALRNVFEADAS